MRLAEDVVDVDVGALQGEVKDQGGVEPGTGKLDITKCFYLVLPTCFFVSRNFD